MTITLRPDVSTTTTDAGLVLLDEITGRYWQLNVTGARVLCLLLDGGSREDAARELVNSHGVSAQRAAADVAALVDALHEARLVIA